MLKLHGSISSVPVLSLRTGGRIGQTIKMIINPNNLKIAGWHVSDRFGSGDLILLANDVRDISERGIIVNDHEVLTPPEELIRLKEVLEIDYELLGKKVVSERGKKYGKVSDFSVETNGLIIKKIYAAQSVLKSFTGGSLSIDRNQIVEITNSKIIIADPTEKATAAAPVTAG